MGKERRSPTQRVPEEMAGMLRALKRDGDPRLNMMLDLAHRNGWVYAALAEVMGMSAEGVRRRIVAAEYFAGPMPTFPLPPRPETKHKPPVRAKLSLPADLIAELRAMRDVARTVNGVTPDDDPRREVSKQFTAKLAALHGQGVAVYALAKALGVNVNTVRFRLARHKYLPSAPSMAESTYGRAHPQRQRRTVCARGHALTGDNVYEWAGRRACKKCIQLRNVERYRASQTAVASDGAA